jgi:hypothetical protein
LAPSLCSCEMDDRFNSFSVLVEPEIITNLESYTSSYWVLHFTNANMSLEMFNFILIE